MLLFEMGVKKIMDENSELQDIILREVVSEIRKIPNNLKEDYVKYLKDLGCFYVQSDEYMVEYFGVEISDIKYNIFNFDGTCLYYKKLVIPIRGFDGSIKALCAYDNGNALASKDFVKYQFSNKMVWSKSNYLFITRKEYEKSLADGYVFIVDGIFDKITLSVLGYNAVSLMGSQVSDTNSIVLDFIDKKIVLPDNDQAGKKLFNNCKYKMNNVYQITQGEEWDIDDYLKDESRQEKFKNSFTSIMSRGFVLGF